jgi:aspartyl-tRNA(Asn)/glutamyl-tRNA(Gln) amidotransferase subunit A
MDPTVAARLAPGLELGADEYIRMLRRHEGMKETAKVEMEGLDGWLAPSVPIVAPPIAETDDLERAKALAVSLTRNAGPMNMFGQCGFSMPVQGQKAHLPVGLQISCAPFEEERALGIALALERIFGLPRFPDVSAFAGGRTETGRAG